MRRVLTAALLVVAMSVSASGMAAAQAPPCNDTDGDGSPSGFEYAQFHILALAQTGGLGAGGHVPGNHRGFSACH